MSPKHDQAMRGPSSTPTPPSRRFRLIPETVGTTLGRAGQAGFDTFGLAAVLALMIAVLIYANARTLGPADGSEPEKEQGAGGSGIVVRSEVVDLWLPGELIELADAPSPIAKNHDDLRRVLDDRKLQALRYGLTIRGHQINGGYSDITYIRHPYDEPLHCQELLDILAEMSDTADRDVESKFPSARVHTVTEAFLNAIAP